MCSNDTSDFLQELWVKYFKCSYKNKSENLLAFLRSLYCSSIKGRNRFESTLFTNDVSGMMRLIIRELLNDLENVCINVDESEKGDNDVKNLRKYLETERGTLILYGIDAMLEKIVSEKENKIESVRMTVIKIINDAELSNILATTLISVLTLIGHSAVEVDNDGELMELPESSISQHFYEQLHRSTLAKKVTSHRSSVSQFDKQKNVSSDDNGSNKLTNIRNHHKRKGRANKNPKPNKVIKTTTTDQPVIVYCFEAQSGTEHGQLVNSDNEHNDADNTVHDSSNRDHSVPCGNVFITLTIVTRLLARMILFNSSLCTNAISLHLELFVTCCQFLAQQQQRSSSSQNNEQLLRLAQELLHNIGITMKILFTERDNDQSAISVLLGHKLIDRLFLAYQFLAPERLAFGPLISDINKVIVYIFIIVAKKILAIGSHNIRGIIQLFTSWHLNDGVNIVQWTLNEETNSADSLRTNNNSSRVTLFAQLCTLLNLLNEFSLERGKNNLENENERVFSHHSDKFNLVPTVNRKDTIDTCCYAMICQVLLDNLIYLLTRDSNSLSINANKKRIYQQILNYIKSVRFCCSIDIFSYSCQLLSLLVNHKSTTVKTVILRFLQILLEISFEFYKSRDNCDCQYTSRHDISLILRDIRDACLPMPRESLCPRQQYATTPVDLLHFFDWLARSHDDKMKGLVIDVVIHPILRRLQSYSDNSQSQQYHLIGAAVLSLMPYLNSQWNKEDLELIGNVCRNNPVLQTTLYKCLTLVLLSSRPEMVSEVEIKTRIIYFLLSNVDFDSFMQSFDSESFSPDEFMCHILKDVPVWHCYRLLFSYNEEFRRIMFAKGGIDCCYIILKQIILYIAQLTAETAEEVDKSVFILLESIMCLVVDGNMLKGVYYYDGFSCDIIWAQLQSAIVNNFPRNLLLSRMLLTSICNCCFRQMFTIQDGLYQLRQVFLDSIVNMSSSYTESDVNSDTGEFEVRSTSSQRDSDLETDVDNYDADVSSDGFTTFDDNQFVVKKPTETLLPSVEKTAIFMDLDVVDGPHSHLEINGTLIELLIKVILTSQMDGNDEIFQETLEFVYNTMRMLPDYNQCRFISDDLVEEMSSYIENMLTQPQRGGLHLIFMKLLILPGSSLCTSTRLRFLIEMSKKNGNLTSNMLQMLIEKASLIQTFQPETSIKQPIEISDDVATDLPVSEQTCEKETFFDYVVHCQLSDGLWRSLDPDYGNINGGFSVSMWLQMDLNGGNNDRKRSADYKKNKRKTVKQSGTNKMLAYANETIGIDLSDDKDLVHIISLYTRDKINDKKSLSLQIWCKPSFGTVVVRLYECLENMSTSISSIVSKIETKPGRISQWANKFTISSNNDKHINEPCVIPEPTTGSTFTLVDESISHGFLTTNSWNFLTITVNWRSQESVLITWLLNGDVKRQTKLNRNQCRPMRGNTSPETFVAIGHIGAHCGSTLSRQHYSLGNLFLFENPIITCGNDNLSLMLMTPNWDAGQIISNQVESTKTLATVVMRLLVDLQATTESAAQLLERGQNILSGGWQTKVAEYRTSNLVGSYFSEDPHRFTLNSAYTGGSSLLISNDSLTKPPVIMNLEPVGKFECGNIIVVKTSLDSSLEQLGGVSVLIFWLAKLVETENEDASQLLLRLYVMLLKKSIFLSFQNQKESGYSLLFQLFKSFKMNINHNIITELIHHAIYEVPVRTRTSTKSCSSSKLCRDPFLLRDLLLQWKMWATSKVVANESEYKPDDCQSVELDKYLLTQISDLLNEDNIYSNINCGSLGFAGILSPLLLACEEPFDILPVPLPSELCQLIVQIITNFIPTPVDLATVTKLCNTILHLYQVSMKDSDTDSGTYFKHIKSFMNYEWANIGNDRESKFKCYSISPGDLQTTPEERSPGIIAQHSQLLNSLDSCRISEPEIRAMQSFYGATLSQNVTEFGDDYQQLKDFERSTDSLDSNLSSVLTLINDDDDPSVIDHSFESHYLSSDTLEANLTVGSPNHSSRIDTLAGLILALENVIQVKISDTILVQLSVQNFCFEFILHLLTHPSHIVRHRSLSLFRVYICQKKLIAQTTIQQPHMINIVAFIISQNSSTAEIVAETVSIIFGQNITDLITDIDWTNSSPAITDENIMVGTERESLVTLPPIDSRARLSGIVSIIPEQMKEYTLYNDMINKAGNHLSLTYRRSSVLLVSSLAIVECPSMVSMLAFCDWLFIQNPILLQASIKSGLLECVCNICYRLSLAHVTASDAAFQALLDVSDTIATDLTASAPDEQFVKLLEMCEIVYFSGLNMAKKLIEKEPRVMLQQYMIERIINTSLETICILNHNDPVSKIISLNGNLQQKVARLPKHYLTLGAILSQKLIKTIHTATSIIINTQEYLFPFFIDLFKLLGLKLVDFISTIISNCLSCNVIPDHFSAYLCAKELIKSNLGDLIIFLTNPQLDISFRLDLLCRLLKLNNADRVTRYSLLGNSSGSMCLILNLKRIIQDEKNSNLSDENVKNSLSSLLRVISLDFDVEIIKEDNRNLWIQDCGQKLNVWKHTFNQTLALWNSNADRCHNELLINLKLNQNSYRPHARKNLQEQYIANIRAQRSSEFYRRRTWKTLITNFTQERAIWSSDSTNGHFMQLDPTEGPCRIRRRMVKTKLNLDQKFFKRDDTRCDDKSAHRDLGFLFDSTYSMDRMVFESPIKFQLLKCIEDVRLACPCSWVGQSGTFDGEFFVGRTKMGFMVDNVNHSRSQYDQLPNPLKDYGFISWRLNEINWVLKRRFKLRDLALEVFTKDGRNCLVAANTTQERDTLVSCIESFLPPSANTKPRLIEIQHQWITGEMTNFDYLTILNTASGRSYNDMMQYPVFPFILTNYSSYTLDLQDDTSFRDLSNPIAVQNPILREKVSKSFSEKAEVYQTQLKISKMSDDMDNMPIWALPPHHYSSLYSNSGTVLYYMIRVPPFTQKFIEFQDHQFDRPDRLFHTLASAWDLSTCSMSCVKEIIPEFFYLPEMFINNQGFNFGERHNGERVDDVVLPQWCNDDARIFCLVHRAALESPRVSSTLSMWIDLIFGFKQTGKAALDAMNLFHPYTYFKAISPDEILEPIRRRAVEQMIENYGQIPKQLFLNRPHASKKLSQKLTKKIIVTRSASVVGLDRLSSISSENIESSYLAKDRSTISVLANVIGLLWGDWVGSPQNGQTFINTISHINYTEAKSLYLLPKLNYNKKSYKVLVLPQCSDALYLPVTDDDCLPIIRFSSTTMKKRVNISSLTLCNSYNTESIVENRGSFFVSMGSGGRSTVSCMAVYQRAGRIFFGMCSGLIEVYQGDVNKYSHITPFLDNCSKHGRTLSGHSDMVTHMIVGESFAVLASCDRRANVAIWDPQRLDLMHYIDWSAIKSVTTLERLSFMNSDSYESSDSSKSTVSAMCFSETLGDLIISRIVSKKASNSPLFSNVSLFTINGQHVKSLLLPGTVISLSYTNLPEGRHVNAIAAATSEGRLTILSSWDLQVVWKIKIPLKNGPDSVLAVQYSHSGKELFVLHESGHVRVIQSNKSSSSSKQSVYFWL